MAILDYQGGITDPGTAFEIGAAYRTNKTIVVYHEQKTPVNIMLTESTQAYLTSLSALETYDFKQQKRIAYVGEYI
ncbi:nucleoside 2-deoxyribosyltransferase [Enterococcus faecium]|nr:nucleoside 2-deoxyribosyltransferase [Enterococcus faecium]